MDHYITAAAIKTLREKKRYTQSKLAGLLVVSDKTVSKRETGKGLPDVTLIEPLAKALGVSVIELMSGTQTENRNVSANLLRSNTKYPLNSLMDTTLLTHCPFAPKAQKPSHRSLA